MNSNINDNPCVCCGEYAVEGSWLCWRCQQEITNEKFQKNVKKVLDNSNNVRYNPSTSNEAIQNYYK